MDFYIKRGQKYRIRISDKESDAVKIAASNLEKDLEKVLGGGLQGDEDAQAAVPEVDSAENYSEIRIGTIGMCEDIDRIAGNLLRDEKGVLIKEAYLLCVREGRLIIAGSDRRGTIYGIYEFCEKIGVSPWYFWADVPVKEKQEIRLPEDFLRTDHPSVEYRGIFINDEEELEAWVKKHMGEETIGVKTYEKVFELLLRLKANYIWPAMHVNSFNSKRENGALAERMGIVVGTSHCDMLMRSNNREWRPWIAKKGYQDAVYDYSVPGRNREILQEYWRESVEQNQDFEVCYTLGMRGIHDSGFETRGLENKSEEEKRQAKVELLETIIRDQRSILRDTLGHDTMMTFIPYKEVLDLYDHGLEVPEDMTLVWANDNYGYIRRYPSEKEKKRSGGNGIYYHNSYWAPPSMSYVFLCSIPLAHTRNELQKAYNEGIRKLWVLNSGAMKPLEQEIEFFLRLAWEIGSENALTEVVDAYVADWIDRKFEGGIGKEVSALLNDFSQLTNVRKLENMDYDAFSQTAYGDEAVVRIHKYEELFTRGNAIYEALPEKEKDAFFQLVLMRIHAGYFTNLQFYYGDRSTLAYRQGKMQAAAYYTKKSMQFDDARRKMLLYYNKVMADGKWDGILNPEGFPPPRAAQMPVCTPPLSIGERGMLTHLWNEETELVFRKPGVKWLELGNAGQGSFDFTITAPDWMTLSENSGSVRTEKRILVRVEDCTAAREGEILVKDLSDCSEVRIPVKTEPPAQVCENTEEDGCICVQAVSAQSTVSSPYFHVIKRLGRCRGSLMEAVREDSGFSAPLCYQVYAASEGEFLLELHRFPSLDSTGRIRIGVSVDEGPVRILESYSNDEWRGNWKKNVLNNVDRLYLSLPAMKAGLHRISLYAVDKYFAFSGFVIYTKERKENNLAGITGAQELPWDWDADRWTEDFYGKLTLKPRPVEYAPAECGDDGLAVTSRILYPERYAKTVEPGFFLQEGEHPFAENNGSIRIDAAAALAQSRFAHADGGLWQHCGSESYGRSGLAMYVRTPGLSWKEPSEAPSLSYQLECEGGEYTVWMLSKFDVMEEAYFAMGVDGHPLAKEELYRGGALHRYEAEQIYRWVPAARCLLEKGSHTLQVYSMASGMRFDRFYLTRGEELPPSDTQWPV